MTEKQYEESELTPWFVHGERPARDGVYQQMCGLGEELGYQKYQKGRWRQWFETPEAAAKACSVAASGTTDGWRGLAHDPATKEPTK